MDLVEITESVLGFGELDTKTKLPVLGLVHPYFCVGYSDSKLHKSAHFYAGSPEDYLEALESMIVSHEGPLVVWEEEIIAHKTAEHINQLGRTGPTYIVLTERESPSPAEGNWGDVIDFLKQFKTGKIQLGGGYYQPENWEFGTTGCLGVTYNMLVGNIGLKVLMDICFAFRKPFDYSSC